MTDSPNKRKHSKSTKLVPIEDSSLASSNVTTTGQAVVLSSKGVQDKKGLLEAVRRLNPAAVNPAPVIFWDVEGNLKNVNIDSSNVKQQVTIVEGGVNLSVRRFNDIKTLCDLKTRILKQKLDEMEGVKREAEELEKLVKAETDEGKRIEQLQSECTKVENSIFSKMHKTRVLEHMLDRLNRNQLKFDAHLNGMQETLKAIEKESVDIKHLRKDLDAGLAKAVIVLDETKALLAVSRKDRECLILQRRNEVKTAQNLQAWLKKRDQSKIDLAIALRGDLSKDEQNFLKKELREKEEKTRKLQSQNVENQKRVHEMEEAFNEIKQVTGAPNLSMMIAKFIDQKTNRKNLEIEVKDAERKLNGLKKEYASIEKSYQDMKTTGISQIEFGRDTAEKIEEEITTTKSELRMLTAAQERTSSIFIGLKQGAASLLQRSAPYSYLLREPGVFDLTSGGASGVGHNSSDESSWLETLDALSSAEQLLAKLMEINAAVGETPLRGMDDDDHSAASITSLETAVEAPTFALNLRIKSKKALREEEIKLFRSKEENNVANTIGSTVMHLLATGAADSPVRPSGIDNDYDEDEPSDPVPKHRKSTSADEDSTALTRLAVKKNSLNTTQEAHRKAELELRKKKLAERLASRMTTIENDEGGIANAARLTAQRESTKKLSTFPQIPTLPTGITLRDDAMTKTKAFLHHVPDLI